jgi:hypothetical protein
MSSEEVAELEKLIDYLRDHPEAYRAYLQTQEAAYIEAIQQFEKSPPLPRPRNVGSSPEQGQSPRHSRRAQPLSVLGPPAVAFHHVGRCVIALEAVELLTVACKQVAGDIGPQRVRDTADVEPGPEDLDVVHHGSALVATTSRNRLWKFSCRGILAPLAGDTEYATTPGASAHEQCGIESPPSWQPAPRVLVDVSGDSRYEDAADDGGRT